MACTATRQPAPSQLAPFGRAGSSGPRWRGTTGGPLAWCAGELCPGRLGPRPGDLPACAPRSLWSSSLQKASREKWAMISSPPHHQVQETHPIPQLPTCYAAHELQ